LQSARLLLPPAGALPCLILRPFVHYSLGQVGKRSLVGGSLQCLVFHLRLGVVGMMRCLSSALAQFLQGQGTADP
jgi:hypothetical protein